MLITEPARAVAATLALLGGLTACGGKADSGDGGFAKEPAASIVMAAQAAMKGLDNVHYSGDVTSDGKTITLDVTASSDGDCQGTFALGEGGGSAEILSVGGTTWFKPDADFWHANAGAGADAIIAKVGTKYVVLPADDNDFADVCDIDKIVSSDDDTESTYSTTGTSQVDGKDTVEVTKKGGDDDGSVGYVLTGGDHYIVKLENTTGDNPGSVSFDEFDSDFAPAAPAKADTIELSALG